MILLIFLQYKGGHKIDRNEYSLSDIVEYNQEYGLYYTTNNMLEFLSEDIYIDGYIHKSEEGGYYLVNIPYLDDYDNLGKYGIISIPIKGRVWAKENTYMRCLSRVKQTEDSLYLKILSAKDIEDTLSTKQEEFKEFLKSGSFTKMINYIEDIPNVSEISEQDRKVAVKNLVSIQYDLEDNFYQEINEIISIVKYTAYVYTNPQINVQEDISSAKSVEEIEESFIYYTLQWGLS